MGDVDEIDRDLVYQTIYDLDCHVWIDAIRQEFFDAQTNAHASVLTNLLANSSNNLKREPHSVVQ